MGKRRKDGEYVVYYWYIIYSRYVEVIEMLEGMMVWGRKKKMDLGSCLACFRFQILKLYTVIIEAMEMGIYERL